MLEPAQNRCEEIKMLRLPEDGVAVGFDEKQVDIIAFQAFDSAGRIDTIHPGLLQFAEDPATVGADIQNETNFFSHALHDCERTGRGGFSGHEMVKSGDDQKQQSGCAPKKTPPMGMSKEAVDDGQGPVKPHTQKGDERYQQDKAGKKSAWRHAFVEQVYEIRQVDRIDVKVELAI